MRSDLIKLFNLGKMARVTWEELDSIPVGVWVDVLTGKTTAEPYENQGVRFKKILTKAHSQLMFYSELKAGHGFDYHVHDCKETITVLSGKCVINDRSTLSENSTQTIFANTKHKVYAKEDTVLLVEFNKVHR